MENSSQRQVIGAQDSLLSRQTKSQTHEQPPVNHTNQWTTRKKSESCTQSRQPTRRSEHKARTSITFSSTLCRLCLMAVVRLLIDDLSSCKGERASKADAYFISTTAFRTSARPVYDVCCFVIRLCNRQGDESYRQPGFAFLSTSNPHHDLAILDLPAAAKAAPQC